MKNFLIFLGGIVTGILLFILIGIVNSDQDEGSNEDTIWFEHPGECISDYKFEVLQALSPGYALATEFERNNYSDDIATGITVLFYSPDEKPFYDEQIIKVPKGKCARQIGTYRYPTKSGNIKTVPIVQILAK